MFGGIATFKVHYDLHQIRATIVIGCPLSCKICHIPLKRGYRSGAARRLFSFYCLISTEFLTWWTLDKYVLSKKQ